MTQTNWWSPVRERPHPNRTGGTQRIFRFPNGFGASVIPDYDEGRPYDEHPLQWNGLHELVLIHFVHARPTDLDLDPLYEGWEMCYAYPAWASELRQLGELDVQRILLAIANLPADPHCNHSRERWGESYG